jgi:hypothetical protein
MAKLEKNDRPNTRSGTVTRSKVEWSATFNNAATQMASMAGTEGHWRSNMRMDRTCIRVFAGPNTSVKPRSRRGWTEPGPLRLAEAKLAAEAATRAKAKAEARAAAAEANRERHFKWLMNVARDMGDSDRMDWLSAHASSPAMVTRVMEALA